MSHASTPDLSDQFFSYLKDIAGRLGAKPRDMLAVMNSESGVRSTAHNPHGDASGLIQFMPDTLKGLGWTRGDAMFRELSAVQQLPYVLDYYAPHRGYLGSVGGLYVATFLPALVKRAGDPAFVLTAKTGPLGWAYAPNSVFDTNKDYAITVGELEQAVARNARGARWAEILERAGLDAPDTAKPAAAKVSTVFEIQQALVRHGFKPGPLDGIPGAKTALAVKAFQFEKGLVMDGIVGPLTRAALEAPVV